MAANDPTKGDGEMAAVLPQHIRSKLFRATMNGTTNVTITLDAGAYWVELMNADPTVFAYGSFAGAPTLPSSGNGTADIQLFPSAQKELLFVAAAEDVGYNVKLSAAGTPELLFVKIR